MIQIEAFRPDHLPHLLSLVNNHLSAVVPGWGLTGEHLVRHFELNPRQYIIDPWVSERQTLVAVEREYVVAAAHLLHYGGGEKVGVDYRSAGDIAWFLCWPDAAEAGARLLEQAEAQMVDWGVKTMMAWDGALPVTLCGGVPDSWPHIAELLRRQGYAPVREEAIYGGWLNQTVNVAPFLGLTAKRTVLSNRGAGFTALFDGETIGACEAQLDLTDGGGLPALRGWAELTEMDVREEWRSRGVGSWLLSRAVEWMRLGGCDRVALAVATDDEARGAGRFYNRMGWHSLARLQVGWHK